ncbi:MAG: TIM barrel protein [Paracoccaceae bacterium]
MTAPDLRWNELLDLAADLGCVGVEFRNDLTSPLFDGDAPQAVAEHSRKLGLRIVGLGQIYPFNSWSADIRKDVAALIRTAVECGAETISLIPRNDGTGLGNGERQANLQLAMREIKPMLEDAGLVALIEPLGFFTSSLRHKEEAVEIIEALDATASFRLVHDTFHHHLAGDGAIFPEHTGIIHISGVTDPQPGVHEMCDEHRVLVDANDRLDSIGQLRAFVRAGFAGPISFEAFSPEVHACADLKTELSKSIRFIESSLAAAAA